MSHSATVAESIRRFSPTLVTTLAILANGPMRDDLVRLEADLDQFGEDLLAAADAEGADLPEPLIETLGEALGVVAEALSPVPASN